jgi:hypothetical protein
VDWGDVVASLGGRSEVWRGLGYKWEHVALSYLHDATRLDIGGGAFGFRIVRLGRKRG